MPLKLTEAEYGALGDDVKASYEKAGEAYYYIGEIKSHPDVIVLSSTLDKERKRADDAEKALKPFEGVDPARFKVLDAAEKARADGKDERAVAWQTEKEQLTTQIATLTATNQALSQENGGMKKTSMLERLFRGSGVLDDRLHAAVALASPLVVLEGDELKGPNGADIKTYESETFRKENSYLYGATVKPGMNASNVKTSPARVISATDQAALNSNIEGLASGAVVVGG